MAAPACLASAITCGEADTTSAACGSSPSSAIRLTGPAWLASTRSSEVYHWYITNLPVDRLKAEEVGKLYAARWTIELLFRELKSCYQLESMLSRKRHVVEAFLYASLLTLLASRALPAGCSSLGVSLADRRTPLERWARLLVSAAPDLLALVLDSAAMARTRERPLLRFFIAEAPDPNVKRKLLPERAGLNWAA